MWEAADGSGESGFRDQSSDPPLDCCILRGEILNLPRILSLWIQQGPSQPLPWSHSLEPFLEMAVNMEPWGAAAKGTNSRVQHLGSRNNSGLAGVSLGKLFNHFAPMFLTYTIGYHPPSIFSLSIIK